MWRTRTYTTNIYTQKLNESSPQPHGADDRKSPTRLAEQAVLSTCPLGTSEPATWDLEELAEPQPTGWHFIYSILEKLLQTLVTAPCSAVSC